MHGRDLLDGLAIVFVGVVKVFSKVHPLSSLRLNTVAPIPVDSLFRPRLGGIASAAIFTPLYCAGHKVVAVHLSRIAAVTNAMWACNNAFSHCLYTP